MTNKLGEAGESFSSWNREMGEKYPYEKPEWARGKPYQPPVIGLNRETIHNRDTDRLGYGKDQIYGQSYIDEKGRWHANESDKGDPVLRFADEVKNTYEESGLQDAYKSLWGHGEKIQDWANNLPMGRANVGGRPNYLRSAINKISSRVGNMFPDGYSDDPYVAMWQMEMDAKHSHPSERGIDHSVNYNY